MNRSSRALSTSQGLLAAQLVLQIIASLFLAFSYKANPAEAYDSIWAIRAHGFSGFLLSLQYWGYQLFFLHALIHLFAMLIWGTCGSEWIPRWFLAIVTVLGGYTLLATGNFLLFDRHGVQSAVIEISIVDSIPFVGPVFADWVRGGDKFGANTLSLWNLMYRLVAPMLLVAFGIVGVVYRRYEDEARPSYRLIAIGTIVPIIIAIFLRTPLGSRGTAVDYNSYDALANWYVLPLHGSLRAFGMISPSFGWVGAIVLPGLFVGLLFVLPWLCKKVTQVFAQALFFLFVVIFTLLALIFGGQPASPFTRALPTTSEQSMKPVSQSEISSSLFEQGKKEFEDNGCTDCHSIDGGKRSSGPDLTDVNKKHSDVDWYVKWIRDPNSVKPGSTMPGYPKLSEDSLKAMAEFLRKPR